MRRAALALACLLAACTADPVSPRSGDCVSACATLSALGCPEAGPTPRGEPCEAWLCSSNSTRPADSRRVACVAHAATCDVARACR